MKYKVRLNCTSFVDVCVEAENEDEAINLAHQYKSDCPSNGVEFGEFLDVEDDDEIEN